MRILLILTVLISILINFGFASYTEYCSETDDLQACEALVNAVQSNTQPSLQLYYQDVYVRVKIYVNGTASNYSHFFPSVDTYTLLNVNGTYDYYENQTSTVISASLEVNGFSNDQQLPPSIYLPSDGVNVVGFLVVVVTLTIGNVTLLLWDSGCDLCPDPTQCVDGFCTTPRSSCIAQPDAVPPNCDLKIYFAWVGTDIYGSSCTSAGSLTSRLRQFSADNVYNQAADIIVTLPDRVKPPDVSTQPL